MKNWLRRQRNKKLQIHFDEDSFDICGYKICAVNTTPDIVDDDCELDFYFETVYDIYLVRLKNNSRDVITICPATLRYPVINLVCETPYTAHNISKILEDLIIQFNFLGLPKIENPKSERLVTILN